MMEKKGGYNGNTNLKTEGIKIEWTKDIVEEYIRCANDVIYWAEKYVKIVHVDHGVINIKLYDFQKEIIEASSENRKVIVCTGRQMGKTTTASIILLHYALFNDAKRIFILANKESASVEVLDRIQLIYENLPLWMQRGVKAWNKKSVEFENESKIVAAATSSSSIRGKACVTGDSKITVREKESGNIYDTTFNFISKNMSINQTTGFLVNDIYEIKSPEGFSKFDGLLVTHNKCIKINLRNGKSLTASYDHQILTTYGFINFENLKIGDEIVAENDMSEIVSIEYIEKELKTFDPINVGENHTYYCNSLVNMNCSYLYIDEVAFVENWDEFYASTYPTISSGKTTKMLFTSTPNSLNHFYDFWIGATDGVITATGEVEKNGFSPIRAPWTCIPSRDEEWYKETMQALGGDETKFGQEYNCIFGKAKIIVQNEEGYIYEISLEELYND